MPAAAQLFLNPQCNTIFSVRASPVAATTLAYVNRNVSLFSTRQRALSFVRHKKLWFLAANPPGGRSSPEPPCDYYCCRCLRLTLPLEPSPQPRQDSGGKSRKRQRGRDDGDRTGKGKGKRGCDFDRVSYRR